MKKLGAGAVTAAMVLVGPLPAAAGHGEEKLPGPRVVADGLDNPRQLNWTEDGETLVVAEAGRGGPECGEQGCLGPTGAVTLIQHPHRETPEVSTPIEGLLSAAEPGGHFALGSNGADATDVADEYIIAGTDAAGVPDQDGALLVAVQEAPDVASVLTYVDLQAAEDDLNPDGAQIHSNPYAVLFVDHRDDVGHQHGRGQHQGRGHEHSRGHHHGHDHGRDRSGTEERGGYALVADAGANTVWKIQPDFSAQPTDGPPPYQITAWATWPTTALPDGTDDPEGPPEFVPTSLAEDEDGNIYVGGLGSEVPGAASVVQFSADGEQLREWGGFTGVTGVAVDGGHLYVSQLFGSTPLMPPGDTPAEEAPPAAGQAPGQVVVLHRHAENGVRYAVDVPFPAGLAADGRNVYAAVNSIAPAEGIPAGGDNPFGEIGGGAVWELDFRDAYRVEPVVPPEAPAEVPAP